MDVFITLITNALIIFFGYRKLKKVKSILVKLLYIALFIMHNCAFILNYLNNLKVQKDSYNFYLNALNASKITDLNFIGSQFMSVIVFPFVKLGISFFSISLIFSTLSFYTFYKYFNHFYNINKYKNDRYFTFIMLIFLTPSLHFWTAGLTKEALIFFFMFIIFHQLHRKKLINIPIVLAFVFILLIRPYLFVILLIAYSFNFYINFNLTIKQKIISVIVLVITILLSTPIAINFLKIKEFSVSQIESLFKKIIVYSQANGNSSVDLLNTNYFERLFLVLFRPLFYDAKTVFQYIISVENIITFILLLFFIKDLIRYKAYKYLFKNKIFLSSTVILTVLFFSVYMYNLGLASRMRIMFMPYLYILIIMFYKEYSYNEKEIN